MKKLLYITLVFTSILLISCKEKSTAIDTRKPYAIKGLEFSVDNDNDNYKVPLYAEPTLDVYIDGYVHYSDYFEPLEYLEDGMKYKILAYDYDQQSAKIKGKENEGWIPVMHPAVIFDKEILFWCIKSVLEGNEDSNCSMYFNFSKITLEESMEKIQYIIDYKGAEYFKTIQHYTNEGAAMLVSIARLIELAPHPAFGENVTNPIHLLAEYANEDTLKFLDNPDAYSDFNYSVNHLGSFYKNAFFDSEGMSAQMHAVKARNYEALKYFYENRIPNYYFARLAETIPEDTKSIYPLIMNTKDNNKKSLADYVAECKDKNIKNLMAVYDMEKHFTMSDCLEYLRELKDWRDFQTLKVLCAPIPYTTCNDLALCENTAFVYLTGEYNLMSYNENLNVRDKPGKGGKVLGKLPYGTKVTVLEHSNEKDTIDEIQDYWYKVSVNGLEGWCFGGYLAYPVKYETLEEIKGDNETLNDFFDMKHTRDPDYTGWLYQLDFEGKHPTVIKETKLLNPKGEDITVKPLDEIEILEKIEGEPGEDLWDYGMQDTNYWQRYYYRYNYYIIRTKDYKTGIIGGSSLAGYKMDSYYDGPESKGEVADSPYVFYYTILSHHPLTDNYETKYYAQLYEADTRTGDANYIKTGRSDGVGFESEPVYLGETRERLPSMTDLIAYRDFEMDQYNFYDDTIEKEPFYSIIFETMLDETKVSYNSYTVNLNTRYAFSGLYVESHDTQGNSEDDYYRYSYCYFESGNREIPVCVFGEFDIYSLDDRTDKLLRHHIEHLKLDSTSLVYDKTGSEDLDYAPEW